MPDLDHRALKARNESDAEFISPLQGEKLFCWTNPRALPWAITFHAFSVRIWLRSRDVTSRVNQQSTYATKDRWWVTRVARCVLHRRLRDETGCHAYGNRWIRSTVASISSRNFKPSPFSCCS